MRALAFLLVTLLMALTFGFAGAFAGQAAWSHVGDWALVVSGATGAALQFWYLWIMSRQR